MTVPEEGPACLETVDTFHLSAENLAYLVDMSDECQKCWKFVKRQIEVKEEKLKEINSQTIE